MEILFQIVTSLIISLTWFTMVFALYQETRLYVTEFRWYVRFGAIYAAVAQATMFQFIFDLRNFYDP